LVAAIASQIYKIKVLVIRHLGRFMTPYLFKLTQENENIYQGELLKYGVEHKLAASAAKILASEKPNELLSSEELRTITEACEQWSTQYIRCNWGVII
jgi:dissimilatory sulfite reductase (desulfoviridin) alpha/beta subunit